VGTSLLSLLQFCDITVTLMLSNHISERWTQGMSSVGHGCLDMDVWA